MPATALRPITKARSASAKSTSSTSPLRNEVAHANSKPTSGAIAATYAVANGAVLTAAPVSIDPYVLASRHETIFEGSQIEGALSRRLGQTQGRGRKDLLSFDANHKALAKETSGDRGCAARTYPRQASQERGDAQRVAARAPSGQRRPYLRRAPPGV